MNEFEIERKIDLFSGETYYKLTKNGTTFGFIKAPVIEFKSVETLMNVAYEMGQASVQDRFIEELET